MGHRHAKYQTMLVKLHEIKKYDTYLLLKCDACRLCEDNLFLRLKSEDFILNNSHKHYYDICGKIKIGCHYHFRYYKYMNCNFLHDIVN